VVRILSLSSMRVVDCSEDSVRQLALAMTLALVSAPGGADPSSGPAQEQWPGYEVAPFAGLSLGGGFDVENGSSREAGQHVGLGTRASFAIALDLRADEAAQYELFYGRESMLLRGDLSFEAAPVVVEYLHAGGLLLLSEDLPVKPYIVAGLGLMRLSPDAPGSSDTRFSASGGMGLRWPVNRHVALRVEGRGLASLINADTAIFCRSDQSGLLCRIHGQGRTFLQGMLLAGVAVNF